MRKELGKFLLDVAKLIIGGVILATIMDDVTNRWIIYVSGSLSVFLFVAFGLFFIKTKKEEQV